MKITNNLNLPQPLVEAVTKDYVYKDKRYSVTQILKGVREVLLTRRHDTEIEQDVADMVWLIFGTAVHKVLEDAQESKDQMKETKVYVELPNGYTLSGQQDLYDEKLRRITDYKTGSVWKVIFGDWKDYRMQCLMYCWIFRKLGFEADNADIIMFLKDWSKTKAKTDANYPKNPIHVEHFAFDDTDFEYIEEWIESKFAEIERCEKLPDEELPLCSEEDRWATPTKYAVMKEGRKSAVKLCDSEEEAKAYIENKELDKKHYIEERKGEDKKCTEYCACCHFCQYWKEHYGQVDSTK